MNLNWTYDFEPLSGVLTITDDDGQTQHGVRSLDGSTVVFTVVRGSSEDLSRHLIVAVKDDTGLDNAILKDDYNVLGLGTELGRQTSPATTGILRLLTFGRRDNILSKVDGSSDYRLQGQATQSNSLLIQQSGQHILSVDTPAHEFLAPAGITVKPTGHVAFGSRQGVISPSGSVLLFEDTQNRALNLGRHVFAAFEKSSSYDAGDLVGNYQLVGLSREVFEENNAANADYRQTTWKGRLRLDRISARLTERSGNEGRLGLGPSLSTEVTATTITRTDETWVYSVDQSGRIEFDTGTGKIQGLASPDGSLIVLVREDTFPVGRSELWYALRVTE